MVTFSTRFSRTGEFSAVMAIFNLLFRFISSHILYTEWLDRGGMVIMETKTRTNNNTSLGGSVRSGSVLTHFPGNTDNIYQCSV